MSESFSESSFDFTFRILKWAFVSKSLKVVYYCHQILYELLRDKQIYFSSLIQEINDLDKFLQYLHNDN